jgi:hypothetical protein
LIFFTLMIFLCCYLLKYLVLPPSMPSCRSWESLGVDNPHFFSSKFFSPFFVSFHFILFSSHVFCSYVLIFFCFWFVTQGLLWIVLETNVNPLKIFSTILYLCLHVNVLDHF